MIGNSFFFAKEKETDNSFPGAGRGRATAERLNATRIV